MNNKSEIKRAEEAADISTMSKNSPRCAAFSILIVDDEPDICNFLQRALKKHYSVVKVAHGTQEAERIRAEQLFDLYIVDINMPGQSGLDWVASFHRSDASKKASTNPTAQLNTGSIGIPVIDDPVINDPVINSPVKHSLPITKPSSYKQAVNETDVIFMTGFAELESAVAAVRLGAGDFILKPFRLEQMLGAVLRCFQRTQLSRENYVLQKRLQQEHTSVGMIGNSSAMLALHQLIARVAATQTSVLIEGETGTGKELVAQLLHQLSGRSGAFVPVNCAAITPELIESELFGHSKGAYTGAGAARKGLFSYADGGTLFLDEISEMPLSLQSKLLRVLEESKIRPIGTEQEKSIDVRIISATNKSLQALVDQGSFRKDLFYRLNILPMHIPPLRERGEDIALLVDHFNDQLSRDLGLATTVINPQQLKVLIQYSWPGNVRELRNLLERALLLNCHPSELLQEGLSDIDTGYSVHCSLAEVQQRHIEKVLDSQQGNKSKTAKALGITRKTLDRKLAQSEDE